MQNQHQDVMDPMVVGMMKLEFAFAKHLSMAKIVRRSIVLIGMVAKEVRSAVVMEFVNRGNASACQGLAWQIDLQMRRTFVAMWYVLQTVDLTDAAKMASASVSQAGREQHAESHNVKMTAMGTACVFSRSLTCLAHVVVRKITCHPPAPSGASQR